MIHLRVFVYLLTTLMVVGTFLVLRVLVPAAINQHNDGGLILALMLIVATPVAWYYYMVGFLLPYLRGELN